MIFVEGVRDAALKLLDIMPAGMAEIYSPRFIQFLGRKEIISLSLSSQMTREEFSGFVNLISEPAAADMKQRAAKDRFLDSLQKAGIRNVALIFNEDLISTRRDIPWRIGLALSRLKRDLRVIPMYRDYDAEKLAAIKRDIMQDILKPLREAELIYPFLMNIDIAKSRSLPEEEAEVTILGSLGDEVFLNTAALFTRDVTGRKIRYRDLLPEEKFARVTKMVAGRLTQLADPAAKGMLEELFDTGLISLEDLPPDVRERVGLISLSKSFLEHREKYLEKLSGIMDGEEYRRRARPLAKIVPYLLEEGRLSEAVEITDLIAGHCNDGEDRTGAARQVFSELTQEEALEEAERAFLRVSKEDRIILEKFFTLCGEISVPYLLRIIRQTDDQWRRKQACEILVGISRRASEYLIKLIDGGELSPDATPTVIRILGGITDEELIPKVFQALAHRTVDTNPTVRREAVHALATLSPGDMLETVHRRLGDPVLEVRREAARVLGYSGDQRAFGSLKELILDAEELQEEESWELAAASIASLGNLYERCPEVREEVKAFLLDVAERGCNPRGLKSLLKKDRSLPVPALASLAYSLGRIGGEESLRVLENLAKSKDDTVSRQAGGELSRLRKG